MALLLRLFLVLLDVDVLKRILTAREEFLFKGCCLRGPVFLRQTCFSHCAFHCCCLLICILCGSSIMNSGYAWIRSNVITTWCLHPHHRTRKFYTMLHSPESPHGHVGMIPTYFKVSETLCCDMSCTRATLFSVFPCCVVFSLSHDLLF